MQRSLLVCLVVMVAGALGCGDDPPATRPAGCSPKCSLGYTCSEGRCIAACEPPCAPTQSCVVRAGIATCVSSTPTDAPASDIVDDFATSDVAQDLPPRDVALPDGDHVDASVEDRASVDVGTVDTAPADTGPLDVERHDSGTTDTGAADAGARAPCGMLGQPCCQARVCIGAALCDGASMRCVAFTPAMNECTTTLRCAAGSTCGGIFSCDDHACLLCVMPGAGALGTACRGSDQCASAFCANSTCTAPCLPGPVGAAACRAMNPQMICAQFTSRPRTDGGVAPTTTFGGCLRSCTRNGDCTGTQICRLQRNDYDDRLDQVCAPPSGMLAPGAACDPAPPMGATAAMFCNNGQCIPTGEHTGYCSPFCATDADCPSADYACLGFMFGRPSGAAQTIRMCSRR